LRESTAQIFSDDPSVFTLSVHGKSNFPLRKQQSRIDVELDAGVGDHEYLQVLEAVLPRVWEFKAAGGLLPIRSGWACL